MLTSQAAPLPQNVIVKALQEFGVAATAEQVAQIQRFMTMLLSWNDKINLTAIHDPLEILYRHFCESMYAVSAVPLKGGRLADVGSGAGFPGIALRIVQPELQVFLIESNVKKATFLAEVVRELGLSGTRVLVSRYEELGEEVAPLDFICSRALGEFDKFLTWGRSEGIGAKATILWIGGRDLEEVKKVKGWVWRDPIPVPHSLQRILFYGEKSGID